MLAVILSPAVPAAARQTGPRTLENLLDQAPGEKGDERTPARDAKPADAAKPTPSPAAPPPGKRLQVPEQSAVDEALELINQAYDEQIKTAGSNPEAAIRTFREAADKTADTGRKYALLLLAERVALDAKARAQALDVVAHRAAIFEIDPLAARHSLLAKIARNNDAQLDPRFFADVVATASRAVAEDRFDLADAAADLALSTAKEIEKDEKARALENRRKKEPPPPAVAAGLVFESNTLQKTVRERRRAAFDYNAARDRLIAAPDDTAAAEIVGRYLCCVKRDWKAGLAALSKGGHDRLRNLATREANLSREAQPNALDWLKLANDWWKLADDASGLSPAEVEALRLHSGALYGDIAGKLTDPVDVALARKRAKETGSPEKPGPIPKPDGETTSRPHPAQPVSTSGTGPQTLDALFPGQGD
jgi:hypothetical protein